MRRLIFILCSCLLALPVRAELVLVANPPRAVEWLSREEVINIFLGRYRLLPSGIAAEPLDLPYESEFRERFYRLLVNKNLAEINAYWSRLQFSGKTRPPQVVSDVREALSQVAAHPGKLAYVERAQLDGRVRVVYEIGK